MPTDRPFLDRLAAAPAATRRGLLCDYVLAEVRAFLGFQPHEELGAEDGFLALGFNSLLAVDFKVLLEERLAQSLRTTVVFECPTPSALAAYLELELCGGGLADPAETLPAAASEPVHEPIAIVGLACRFPGARDADAYWNLQLERVDATSEIPRERWDNALYYDPDRSAPGRIYVQRGGFLERIDEFDAAFFGISPREASELDPQQRLLLESCWEALERAGTAPSELRGRPAGIFVGTRGSDYFVGQADGRIDRAGPYHAAGNALSTAAGRIAYTLGATGPCFALDTACSSSLVAVHAALRSLRQHECELALAGGVNLVLDPVGMASVCRAGMLSPEGRCKSFAEGADGYVRAEGCGIVVLRRLSDARARGDRILALLRGSAINQDGASGGLTVPSARAQEEVIRLALRDAGVHPAEVDFVETHGTGTALGDPIEARALAAVFGSSHSHERPLWLGAVKANIGHCEPAAGIAGLIKAVLALQRGELPPHPCFERPSTHIAWHELPLRVPTERVPWERGARPRFAGVSSFGFSGTNAHAVLEEAPAADPSAVQQTSTPPDVHANGAPPAGEPELVPLSAAHGLALAQLAEAWHARLAREPRPSLSALARTAREGRAPLRVRRALLAGDLAELEQGLARIAAGHETAPRSLPQAPRVAFLFTGQGAQRAGMGRELYARWPVFRAAIDEAQAVLAAELEHPLRELLWGERAQHLRSTRFTQPALVAFELALARLWASVGIEPAWVLGHSVGEIAAAAVAGCLSEADALRLAAARGRLMEELCAPGAMLAVFAGSARVLPHLEGREHELALAAENGPANTVVSGERAALEALDRELQGAGLRTRFLDVSHAFHSPLIEPMLAPFRALLGARAMQAPRLGYVSNLSGAPVSTEVSDPGYWAAHARAPVRFARGLAALAQQGVDALVEIGPAPVLIGLARAALGERGPRALASQRPPLPESRAWLAALGELYELGALPRWRALAAEPLPALVELPTYPFQRERHWLERPARPSGLASAPLAPHARACAGLLGERLSVASLPAGQRVYEARLSASEPSWAGDHRAFGHALWPAAAWGEAALQLARELGGGLVAGALAIRAPLPLGESTRRVQLVLEPAGAGGFSWSALSQASDAPDEPWTLHASGALERATERAAELGPTARAEALHELRARCTRRVAADEHYAHCAALGLDYGPAFRGLLELECGSGEAWARVRLPEGLDSQSSCLHPALLDACFQISAALVPPSAEGASWLPIGLERLECWREGVRELECCARVRESSASSCRFDLELVDERGELVGRALGLSLVRAERAAVLRALGQARELLHRIDWPARPLASAEPAPENEAQGAWLLAGEPQLAGALAARLEARGGRALCVATAELARQGAVGLARVLAHPPLAAGWRALVLVCSEDEHAGAGSAPAAARANALCARALQFAQASLQARAAAPNSAPARLWFVTRGAQAAGGSAFVRDPEAASVWGLAASLALEHPELGASCIDLDPCATAAAEAQLELLQRELCAEQAEARVALRGGKRTVARLVRASEPRAEGELLAVPAQAAYRLRSADWGVLERLRLEPLARRAPGPGEVELEVRAAGLNLKDVLHALGMLKEHSAAAGIRRALDQPLGLECAGVVVRVGAGVSRFAPGDEVLALGADLFASHALVPASALLHKPAELSFEQAAAQPVAFATAIHALQRVARLQRGERVLIHAAAGGVGLAALAVARRIGAVVHATASPSKWEALRRLGVQHVMSSRTLDFRAELLRATDGRGVEVALNSLNGEFIPATLDVLAPHGRMVEIGKVGAWTSEQVAARRADVAYARFDLEDERAAEPGLLAELLAELERGLRERTLAPIPTLCFPIAEAPRAFAFLAQARNVGKLALSLPRRVPAELARDERSYLVTGGLGGLGLQFAAWLVEGGARRIALVGRGAASPQAERLIEALRARGARVLVHAADIAQRESVRALLARIDAELGPLAGVVHAAGVLEDGTFAQQTSERFERALAPKLAGAQHLDELLGERPLEFFLSCSSVAAALGSAGQAPYAAANAALDAQAHARRARGAAASSLAFGPWNGEGMAGALDERARERLRAQGMRFLEPAEALGACELALAAPDAQLGVFAIDAARVLERARGRPQPLLERLAHARETDARPAATRASAAPSANALRERLSAAPPAERPALLRAVLAHELARVLGYDSPERIDPSARFLDLGIDSLLAVDLRNRLESALERSLPAALAFDHPTLDALTEYVLAGFEQGDATSEDALRADIEQLSEAEVLRLLAAEGGHV